MPVETNGNRDNKMMQPTRLSSGIVTLVLFLIILTFLVLPSMSRPSRVLYSTFLQQVRAGKVAQASVGPTEIRYALKPAFDQGTPASTPQVSTDPKLYTTIPVESDLDLVKLLEEAAQHLLKQEVLEGETLDAYLAQSQMPPGIDEWLKTGEVNPALAQMSN